MIFLPWGRIPCGSFVRKGSYSRGNSGLPLEKRVSVLQKRSSSTPSDGSSLRIPSLREIPSYRDDEATSDEAHYSAIIVPGNHWSLRLLGRYEWPYFAKATNGKQAISYKMKRMKPKIVILKYFVHGFCEILR